MVGFFSSWFSLYYVTTGTIKLSGKHLYLHLVAKILYVGYILVVGIVTNNLKISVRLYYCEKEDQIFYA